NFEVGVAPRAGPATASVTSAPTTETNASETRRRFLVAGPPKAIPIVEERYPPTMSAITTRNETFPEASPDGSGWSGTTAIFSPAAAPAAVKAVVRADATGAPAAGAT